MDWLDAHAGSMQAVATLVLVAITAYYAYASRALVRESRMMLQATARASLQERLDRLSEITLRDPGLFKLLDDPNSDGTEFDARFSLANMYLAILEEAHTQRVVDGSMPADDWRAWVATTDAILRRPYMGVHWRFVQDTYEPSFQRFVNERLRLVAASSPATTAKP